MCFCSSKSCARNRFCVKYEIMPKVVPLSKQLAPVGAVALGDLGGSLMSC